MKINGKSRENMQLHIITTSFHRKSHTPSTQKQTRLPTFSIFPKSTAYTSLNEP